METEQTQDGNSVILSLSILFILADPHGLGFSEELIIYTCVCGRERGSISGFF